MVVRMRLAVRLAAREVRRALGRSVLVVVMVAVPVAAVVATSTLLRTDDVSPAEALPGRVGQADARVATYPFTPDGGVYANPATGQFFGSRQERVDVPDEPEVQPDEVNRTTDEVLGLLDDVERSTVLLRGTTSFGAGDADGRTVDVVVGDLGDPLLGGLVQVQRGRLAATADEVALTPALVRPDDAVGDVVRVGPGAGREVVVVGVVDLVDLPDARAVLAASAADDLLLTGDEVDTAPTVEVYVDVPGDVGLEEVLRLNEAGYPVVSRALAEDPPAQEEWGPPDIEDPALTASAGEVVGGTLVGALVVLEVVLLAGPAFAVGARRQERDLALLAATGAAPADLRRVVLAQGVLLGALAAVVGGAAGLGLAAVAAVPLRARDLLDGPFDPDPRVVVGVVALGALAGLAAAWLPARRVVRRPVAAAPDRPARPDADGLGLPRRRSGPRGRRRRPARPRRAGRRRRHRPRRDLRRPRPRARDQRAARRRRTARAPAGRTSRLVVRDLARNRARNAPAVAAVIGAVAAATVLGLGMVSLDADTVRRHVPQVAEGGAIVRAAEFTPDWSAAEAVLGDVEQGRQVARVDVPATADGRRGSACLVVQGSCFFPQEGGSWLYDVAVVDPDVLPLLGRPVPEGALDGLRDGLAVTFVDGSPGEVVVGLETDEVLGPENGPPRGSVQEQVALPALRVPLERPEVPALVLVPPALADRLPHGTGTASLVLAPGDAPLDAEDAERLQGELASAVDADVLVETGPNRPFAVPTALLSVLAAVLVLVAGLAGGRLALVEAEPDLRLLHQVGASPGLRRRFAVGSAAGVTLLGALLGVAAGLPVGVTAAVVITGEAEVGVGAVVGVPWALLALLVVGLPALVAALAAATTRTRLT